MFARPQVDRLFTNGRALTRFQSLDAFSFGTADDLDECHIMQPDTSSCAGFLPTHGPTFGIAACACDAKETYYNRKCRESAASLCHGQGLQAQPYEHQNGKRSPDTSSKTCPHSPRHSPDAAASSIRQLGSTRFAGSCNGGRFGFGSSFSMTVRTGRSAGAA